MKLGIVYHTPFWQTPDGYLWEAEGSFARYVESLAPYFEEVFLCVPMRTVAGSGGYRLRAANVYPAPLPYFDGPRYFYPRFPAIVLALSKYINEWDILHCRVPTPAALPAFLLARRRALPTFLLIVGDLRGVFSTLTYRGVKRLLYRAYVVFEEWGLRHMIARSLTFTNGDALYIKHLRHGPAIVQTNTTTINAGEIADRENTCEGSIIRLLCVSRVESRKGLRCIPAALERLTRNGKNVIIDIIGPTVGRSGEKELETIMVEAIRLCVERRISFLGSMPLDVLLPLYRQYDLFVLPTLPGEGIPRVLLEAMAAGLPVVTTDVAGIPSLVTHEVNGLLMRESSAVAVAEAVSLLIDDPMLRQHLISNGYETARAHTLENQARWMMERVASHMGLMLRGLG